MLPAVAPLRSRHLLLTQTMTHQNGTMTQEGQSSVGQHLLHPSLCWLQVHSPRCMTQDLYQADHRVQSDVALMTHSLGQVSHEVQGNVATLRSGWPVARPRNCTR
jgi:hypothetical protein